MYLKLVKKITYLFKLYVLRDAFLISAINWFLDKGDETLRLSYQLDKSSIVLDVGGYVGDYAEAINKKYGCRVYLFEPVPSFYNDCVIRFSDNPSIVCLNYGLSSSTGWFEIGLDDNASSFKKIEIGEDTQLAQLRSVTEVFASLNSLMPLPIPLIRSGIFLPPKKSSITNTIKIHSEPPGMASINWLFDKVDSILMKIKVE